MIGKKSPSFPTLHGGETRLAAERQLSLPPHDSLQAALSLAFTPGVGPKIRMALVERFGSPEAVLAASPQQWRETPGVGAKLANNLANAQRDFDLEALLPQQEVVAVVIRQQCAVRPVEIS